MKYRLKVTLADTEVESTVNIPARTHDGPGAKAPRSFPDMKVVVESTG
jgi:hypothetical protein